jgi:hypothetical protein
MRRIKMKKITCLFMMFVALGAFGQETVLNLSWGMDFTEIKEIHPEVYMDEDTAIIDTINFAGYRASALMGVHPEHGLLLVWIMFREEIDESELKKALKTKYTEINGNMWDWFLYANFDRSTYVSLETPIGDSAWLKYYKGEIYEIMIQAQEEERASDL